MNAKKTRLMRSFEADADVFEMLEAAQDSGLTLQDICNRALRECGPKVIKSLASQQSAKLKKLAGSFDYSDRQTGRELIAA